MQSNSNRNPNSPRRAGRERGIALIICLGVLALLLLLAMAFSLSAVTESKSGDDYVPNLTAWNFCGWNSIAPNATFRGKALRNPFGGFANMNFPMKLSIQSRPQRTSNILFLEIMFAAFCGVEKSHGPYSRFQREKRIPIRRDA